MLKELDESNVKQSGLDVEIVLRHLVKIDVKLKCHCDGLVGKLCHVSIVYILGFRS